ncbi:LacI family DNA-binding transcriptional regulator [Martelella mangrovi]|uniref:LacI family repressor for deo operon, udp, cdd, tsx, nupC, and nupG n=1 Tax=Martelella mangrovi TaxID=1397477 RepID=A0ABV2ICR5_9HYPH
MKKNKAISGEEGNGPLMADVARLAGVAISTVSRALATPDRVNAKTREKIMRSARQLGYTPNAIASSLRAGKSNLIMIILPGSLFYGMSQVIPQILHSINTTLARNGYHLMIANLDRDETSERHILNLAFGSAVRGALIFSSDLPDDGSRSFADTALPVVSILRDLSGLSFPSVVTNDRAAMREATEKLIGLGHQRFLYITAEQGNYHDRERYGGVVDAMETASLPKENIVLSGGALSYQEGFRIGTEAADHFATLAEKPTAVLATSDDMAVSFMSAVRQQGWRIPEDISIISFDGSPACAFCFPPLSAIEQPVEAMGRAAAELLVDLIERNERASGQRVVIPSRLICRESIAAPS